VTAEDFIRSLPRRGWAIDERGYVCRADDIQACPVLYARDEGLRRPGGAERRRVFLAADGRGAPALRRLMVERFGLRE
jgi:hypothetical protein